MLTGSVLLTGGTGGIGQAILKRLVEADCRVAITYQSNSEAAQQLEQETDGRARAYQLDITDGDAVDRVVERVQTDLGELAGLVNNAGIQHASLLALTSTQDWSRVVETNLGGAFRCCRSILPQMVHRRAGSIVNVASLAALRGVAGSTAYAAAKAGVVGMTRALAREVGKRGIRVNAVAPGFLQTEMTANIPANKIAAIRAGECLPAGVEVSCVAETVCFLLSPASSSITGQCWVVDAGASA